MQTACYGVRVYTNTSWLANHVDTKATHAVSVIMQVDQVRKKMRDKLVETGDAHVVIFYFVYASELKGGALVVLPQLLQRERIIDVP